MDVGILDQAKDRTGILRIQSRQGRLIAMPVVFLHNRKIKDSDEKKNLQEIMIDHNYTQCSECQELFIMSRELGENDALQATNSVGIIAADVEVNSTSFPGTLPKRISKLNAVLTLVYEAQLPPSGDNKGNVVTMN